MLTAQTCSFTVDTAAKLQGVTLLHCLYCCRFRCQAALAPPSCLLQPSWPLLLVQVLSSANYRCSAATLPQ